MTREDAILCLKGIKNYGRDIFTEQSDWQESLDMAIKALEQEPKPMVEPVIHARWIMRGGKIRCSNCDALSPLTKGWEDGCRTYTHSKTKFCSECGAKMVEPQESEE